MADIPLAAAEALFNRLLTEKLAPMAALSQQVQSMEEELGRAQVTVSALAARTGAPVESEDSDDDLSPEVVVKDTVWRCLKCGPKLGLYDTDTDVVRVRYKDHTVYSHLGVGGWIRVICRSCGQINTLDYTPGADIGAVPVVDGIASLTHEVLLVLLGQAEASPDGRVAVRVG